MSEGRSQKLIIASSDLLSIPFLFISDLIPYIEYSYKWISPEILFFNNNSFRKNNNYSARTFLFDSNSSGLVSDKLEMVTDIIET